MAKWISRAFGFEKYPRRQPYVTGNQSEADNDVTVARSKRQPDVIVPFNKLIQGERIGSGAFATVYKARHVDWGCHVAYKKLRLELSDLRSAFLHLELLTIRVILSFDVVHCTRYQN